MRLARSLAGLVWPSVVVAALAAALSSSSACAQGETKDAPDAGTPKCKVGPVVFCQPVAANVPSCNTSDGSSALLTQLPPSTAYPVGCVINFVGERDREGDCRNDGVCKCLVAELPSSVPVVEGGVPVTDAAVPPPPPAPEGPRWNCAP